MTSTDDARITDVLTVDGLTECDVFTIDETEVPAASATVAKTLYMFWDTTNETLVYRYRNATGTVYDVVVGSGSVAMP